jgi:hypothetical protein
VLPAPAVRAALLPPACVARPIDVAPIVGHRIALASAPSRGSALYLLACLLACVAWLRCRRPLHVFSAAVLPAPAARAALLPPACVARPIDVAPIVGHRIALASALPWPHAK